MIACFMDDSGKESDHNARFVSMAGYATHELRWGGFLTDWLHFLLKHGIAAVHMRYLIPITGDYRSLGWDTPKRDEVLSDFIGVIRKHDLIGFGVAVDANAWKSMVPEHIKKREGDAQQFCFARMAKMIIRRMNNSGIQDVVTLTYDTDREFGAARFRYFSELWNRDPDARKFLASINFADVMKYPQLQAADILAWEGRKGLLQKIGGFDHTQRWQHLFAALPSGIMPDYESQLWDEETIRDKLVPELLAMQGGNRETC